MKRKRVGMTWLVVVCCRRTDCHGLRPGLSLRSSLQALLQRLLTKLF